MAKQIKLGCQLGKLTTGSGPSSIPVHVPIGADNDMDANTFMANFSESQLEVKLVLGTPKQGKLPGVDAGTFEAIANVKGLSFPSKKQCNFTLQFDGVDTEKLGVFTEEVATLYSKRTGAMKPKAKDALGGETTGDVLEDEPQE